MVQFFFVKVPKDVRFSEARAAFQEICECQVKNAARGCFFIRVEKGDLRGIADKIKSEEPFVIEPAKSVSADNWDTLRMPGFMNKGRQGGPRYDGPRQEGPRQGGQNSDRRRIEPNQQTSSKPYHRAPNTQSNQDKPPRDGPAPFRAFVLPLEATLEEVKAHFLAIGHAPNAVELFPEKKHTYFDYNTLDDVRAARQAFKDKPLKGCVVRPYMTNSMRRTRAIFQPAAKQQ